MGTTKRKILWESDAHGGFFGMKISGEHYTLFSDAIMVKKNGFHSSVQEVPLWRITAKEIHSNFFSRLFHCGRINLITGYKMPDITLRVKYPEQILELIDQATIEERQSYDKRQSAHRRRY